jgi:hypothetical protein
MRVPAQHIECFHLVFLRMLEARVDRAHWVVKGGTNLRAWFGSLRYSEDMDMDVVRGSVHSLRGKIDKLLESGAFKDMLQAQGLALSRATKPKQTETTQRWKFELKAEGVPVLLHTKIEFSRRGSAEEYSLEPVRPEIVRPYALLAPTANHYTARSAVRQKIEALAGRPETQARDVWDLEHLFRTTEAKPGPLTPAQKKTAETAIERAMALPFEAFKSQVVPYLGPEHVELYGTPEAWDRIRELVLERLSEAIE